MRAGKVVWVSWPGRAVDKGSQEGIRKRLEAEHSVYPVFLSPELEGLYYRSFCNGVLWPLLHCIPTEFDESLLSMFTTQYDAYNQVNQLFLERVAEVYEEGDLVLVYDYELMLLPAMLRRRFPDVACGFFFHCPFPSSEFYRILPVRQALLHGVLGADLVSFNHFDYVRHFLGVCMRILGLEVIGLVMAWYMRT